MLREMAVDFACIRILLPEIAQSSALHLQDVRWSGSFTIYIDSCFSLLNIPISLSLPVCLCVCVYSSCHGQTYKMSNPVEHTFGASDAGTTAHSIPYPVPLSEATYHIAGITVSVIGLSELPSTSDVAVLCLLHPRLQTHACMTPFAAHIIIEWNKYRCANKTKKGLIAVLFDQRNHGQRLMSAISNESWRSGNERHAQDMFSCYTGSTIDTSLVLDHLAAYVFPHGEHRIVQNLILGISLGAHAAWQSVMQDVRIGAAIIALGCPDFRRLMSDRARLSKRKTWLQSQGMNFVRSRDFPPALVESVKKYDPVGLLWGRERLHRFLWRDAMSAKERDKIMPLMAKCFENKRLLCLSGGADKLVRREYCTPFLDWLKKSIGKGGWLEDMGTYLEDRVYPGVGHEVPGFMVDAMVNFVNETLDGETQISMRDLERKI